MGASGGRFDGHVAIVGVGCRLPGGVNSMDGLWAALEAERCLVSQVPADRFEVERFVDEVTPREGKSYTAAGGFLEDMTGFDAEYFGISPKEAVEMDPQQRLLLEMTAEALDDAAIDPASIAGTGAGVFIGISDMSYILARMRSLNDMNAYSVSGSALSIAANRLSRTFDLRGPSMAIDTACSSSLTALERACQEITSGEAGRGRVVLAGGVNVLLNPFGYVGFSQASMLSRSGRCAAFSAEADGFVRAEGGAIVVLKRLSDALAAGDRVHGVLAGWGSNSDGWTAGLALPSAEAQEALLRRVYREAGIDPDHLVYVEAHGTGTRVGDPVECQAIGRALAGARTGGPLPIGSVKSNLGHLEPASGMAGLLKALLVLRHGRIPASLHADTLNPDIDFAGLGLEVVTGSRPLPHNGRPYVGVSSYGFGGSNAHVIVTAPTSPAPPTPSTPLAPSTALAPSAALTSPSAALTSPTDLTPSATSASPTPQTSPPDPIGPTTPALGDSPALASPPGPIAPTTRALADSPVTPASSAGPTYATSPADPTSPDGRTPPNGRASLISASESPASVTDHMLPFMVSARSPQALAMAVRRMATVLEDTPPADFYDVAYTCCVRRGKHPYRLAVLARDAAHAAEQLSAADLPVRPAAERGRVGLVFNGNGSQWAGMGADLLAADEVFRDAVARADRALASHLGWSVAEVMAAPPDTWRLATTAQAQPLLFAVQVGVTEMLRARGVVPAGAVGHSVGEMAAAWAVGALTLADAARVVAARSQAQEEAAGIGRMAAVGMPAEQAERLLSDYDGLELAAVNSDRDVTVAGPEPQLARLADELARREVFFRLLDLDYAFHSAAMGPVRAPLLDGLEGLRGSAPHIPLVSTVTGDLVSGADLDAGYWWRNVREPVLFAQAVRRLIAEGVDVLVEVGPQPILRPYLSRITASREASAPSGRPAATTVTLRRGKDGPRAMRQAVTALLAAGADVEWRTSFPRPGRVVALPSYPWQRERHHAATPLSWIISSGDGRLDHPLLGERLPTAAPSWQGPVEPVLAPWLADHRVAGAVVWPGTGYAEMALAAGRRALEGPVEVRRLELTRMLVLDWAKAGRVRVQTSVAPRDGTVEITSTETLSGRPRRHARGRVRTLVGQPPQPLDLPELAGRCERSVGRLEHYAACERAGLGYGPAFRVLQELRAGAGEVLARYRHDAGPGDFAAHPALLDGALQAGMPLLAERVAAGETFLPAMFGAARVWRTPAAEGWVHVRDRTLVPDEPCWDILIADDDGAVTAELQGVRLRRLAGQAGGEVMTYETVMRAAPHEDRPVPPSPLPAPRQILAGSAEQLSGLRRAREESGRDLFMRCGDEVIGRSAYELIAGRLADRTAPIALADLVRAGDAQWAGRFFGLMFVHLERLGLAAPMPDGRWRLVPDAMDLDKPWRTCALEMPQLGASMPLMLYFGRSLPALLDGTAEPLRMLTEGGTPPLLQQFYDLDPACRHHNRVTRALLETMVADWPRDRALRILEVGAGTGGLTAALLPSLPAERTRYTYTDISAYFFTAAEKRFAAYDFIDYRTLDLNADPAEQGFTLGGYDVVVAGNALHTARNLPVMLRRLAALLSPGGQLLAFESDDPILLAPIFAGLEGFWAAPDDPVRSDTMLLSRDQWPTVLAGSGFTESVLAGGEHERAFVILARASRTPVNAPAPTSPVPTPPAPAPLATTPPVPAPPAPAPPVPASPAPATSVPAPPVPVSPAPPVLATSVPAQSLPAESSPVLTTPSPASEAPSPVPAASGLHLLAAECAAVLPLAQATAALLAESEGCIAQALPPSQDNADEMAWAQLLGGHEEVTVTLLLGEPDARPPRRPDGETEAEISRPPEGLHEVEQTVRRAAILRAIARAMSELPDGVRRSLVVVTRPSGALPAPERPLAELDAAVWGMARTLANEHGEVRVRRISLERESDAHTATPAPATTSDISGTIDNAGAPEPHAAVMADALRLAPDLTTADLGDDDAPGEDEIVLTAGGRFVPRVRPRPAAVSPAGEGDAYRLELRDKGLSYRCAWVRMEPPASPPPGTVTVAVRTAALNYRDIMQATGLLPTEAVEAGITADGVGFEFAGVVTAVGEGVNGLAPGDRVAGAAPLAMATHVIAPVQTIMVIPDGMTFAEAATMPVAFATVHHALGKVARLQAGETLLVHGGAGAVGLAAEQYARLCGARVLATAGSEIKRELLRSLGVRDVFDSRTLDFADEVLRATEGRGVDVVINSLAGEALTRSLELLAPSGRFIELGKRDIFEDNPLPLHAFRNNVTFSAIALDTLLAASGTSDMFGEISERVRTGAYRPLPHLVFPAARCGEAFEYLQHSRHIGKVVVALDQADDPVPVERRPAPPTLDPDGTYLVTGGLGGFGGATALHLAGLGARHLALVSRRGPDAPEAATILAALAGRGVRARAYAADCADHDAMALLVREIGEADGGRHALRGVVHAAMHLDDTELTALDDERVAAVLTPKLAGGRILDLLTREADVDLFCVYSSGAAAVGNVRQSAYVAGNLYLEALIRRRRANGAAGLAVAWGALDDVGYVARNDLGGFLSAAGLQGISSGEALAILDELMAADAGVAGAGRYNWPRLNKYLRLGRSARFGQVLPEAAEGGQSSAELRAMVAALPPDEALATIAGHLAREVAKIMHIEPDRLDHHRRLDEYGLDSLMAAELLTSLDARFDLDISVMELLNSGGTISGIAETLLLRLGVSAPPPSNDHPPGPPPPDDAHPVGSPTPITGNTTGAPPPSDDHPTGPPPPSDGRPAVPAPTSGNGHLAGPPPPSDDDPAGPVLEGRA
ncbi:beta-ketoacyl synthase N-terminal-like domain-containing protein [Nonomuraea sp. NPDC050404]|uniref:beta-ketoacyl synthase N-terminal-like domain-containing protein n=1 Tax=Nonomuraea sp. NPDC050404 TaxID=3155783 RepID=UPI003411664D